jgi:hypothetical protein
MPVHFRLAALAAVFAAGLVALPACKKKDDDGPPDGPMGLSSGDRNAIRTSQNNLKYIGIAFHNYHDVNNSMPIGIVGPGGKPGLSWRVQILPYIEQENLYKMFKLDEPWDSENNKKLISMMPKTYAAPETDPTSGKTYYRSFTGPGALMQIPTQGVTTPPGQPFRGPSLFAISDGTSNTFAVVEAAEAVPWTKPDELVFDPKGPLPMFGGVFRDGMNAVLCDGSVRFLRGDTPPNALKAMITINGGEVIELP